ncbi:GTPase-activating protein [Aspergillus nanangensis]|uniref:ABC multidrug transporter MDR2 n=1 Tax=Aspergillus nanangensis TaxID=2582783 RepID=A0AAD4CNG5_ASPNN|nr:GTPase-activating protein [Aspergillus nanangensis]
MSKDKQRTAPSIALQPFPPTTKKESHREVTLSESEKHILDRQLETHGSRIGFLALYRYAGHGDLAIIVLSTLAAMAGGVALPLFTVIFGNLTSTFRNMATGAISYDHFSHQLTSNVVYFIYIAGAMFLTIGLSTIGFIYTGDHIVQKIRVQYLQAILRQNIGFFDALGPGEITSRIIADTHDIQDGISEKVGLTITGVATFVTAFIIAYIKYWKLALVCSATLVAFVLIMGGASVVSLVFNQRALEAHGKASSFAEEILGSIRTVVAFEARDTLARKYDALLLAAQRPGMNVQAIFALMVGALLAVMYLNYGLGFWMGSRFLVDAEHNNHIAAGDVLTILMAIILGSYNLGNVAPNTQALSNAVAAATKLYATIDRNSPLDGSSVRGRKLDHVRGSLTLQNIRHVYPSRPEVMVLDGVSVYIPAGKTTAFVGPSGSGKSTLVGLIERFYDPIGGTIALDGHNIQGLNLRWLRQQVSLVAQEPKLFAATVAENIRFGLVGSSAFDHETEHQIVARIEQAARMANAHDFILALPQGYDTHIGNLSLSGGQKQRIAIARAIIKNPTILLLDEATSALDARSEGAVQAALDKASVGRTTVVIAHRLATIREADNIVVVANGRIVEQGAHDALMAQGGLYCRMVETQQVQARFSKLFEPDETSFFFDYRTDDSDDDDDYFNSDSASDLGLRSGKHERRKSRRRSILSLPPRPSPKQRSYSSWTLLKFLFSFNRPEWQLIVLGLIVSVLAGGVQPSQAVLFAKGVSTLSLPPLQYPQLRHDANFWSLMFLMIGLVTFLLYSIQGAVFAFCSEKLLYRVRSQAFRAILAQDISFFDRDDHTTTPGALVATLSTEVKELAALSGTTLGTLLIVTVNLVASITIAIIMGWKLGLVCLSAVPVLLLCGFTRVWILSKFQHRAKQAYQKSASTACEAAAAIHTVVSLTMEQVLVRRYEAQLLRQLRGDLPFIVKSALLYASSQALPYLCMALGFWYGGSLLGHGEYSVFQFYVCFSEIIFGAQAAGTVFSVAPAMGKARHAATEFKGLFSATTTTNPAKGLPVKSVRGSVEFRNVTFAYPARIDQPALRHLDLNIKSGQYVALVGASGSGKSTVVALLQRFYDALAGGIYIDGRNIVALDTAEYRSHLALVSQEPSLFQGTVRENILLGSDSRPVSEDALLEACRAANVLDFVMSLPQGFDTTVGSKGGMLSGGQKQRIAIARALVRNPRVLLLDEATSALDSESEKVVQQALDAAAHGRTTIAVAHRLSTIQRADMIFVLDQGAVVESGTHRELIQRRGQYYELVNLQALG